MNPLTNTPTRTYPEFYISPGRKDDVLKIPAGKQPLGSIKTTASLDQQLSKVKHETTLISNLTTNYYHSFVHGLFSQFNKENKMTLLFESKVYEIHEVNLKILLPSPYHQDIWHARNQLTDCLSRGSTWIDGTKELFFYFSFLTEEKTSIEIVDIPFIMLSLIEVHQNEMKAFLKGEQAGLDKGQLPFDIKYKLTSFKIMMEYLIQRGGIEPGKVSIKRY